MEKRGISAIVATILIILMTVLGVGIIWGIILPLFKESGYLSYSEIQLRILIQGYTIYYPEEHFAFVQIERENDEINLTGLEIGFNFEGTTKTYQTIAAPGPNGKYTYKFNFTKDLIEGIPEKVTVAPIFILGNKVKLGEILDEKDMPSGMVHLSATEWIYANNAAAENILKETTSGGAVPFCGDGNIDAGESCDDGDNIGGNGCSADCEIELTDCDSIPLNQEGKTYVLINDVSTSETCFNITANEITLNFNGKTIDGDDTGGHYGVYVNGYEDITIKNGGIKDFGTWEAGNGIYLANNQNNNIINMIITSHRWYSIYLSSSNNNTLASNTVYSDESGYGADAIRLDSSSYNNITGTNMATHWGTGISLVSSNYNILTSNTMTGGFGGGGFSLSSSSNNILTDNTASSSSGAGFYLISSSNNNVLTDNTANSNFDAGGFGVYMEGSSNNIIQENTACGNSNLDFYCDSSTGTTGTLNFFDSLSATGCDAWPEIGTNYNPCP